MSSVPPSDRGFSMSMTCDRLGPAWVRRWCHVARSAACHRTAKQRARGFIGVGGRVASGGDAARRVSRERSGCVSEGGDGLVLYRAAERVGDVTEGQGTGSCGTGERWGLAHVSRHGGAPSVAGCPGSPAVIPQVCGVL
jgi:hypothetical protein